METTSSSGGKKDDGVSSLDRPAGTGDGASKKVNRSRKKSKSPTRREKNGSTSSSGKPKSPKGEKKTKFKKEGSSISSTSESGKSSKRDKSPKREKSPTRKSPKRSKSPKQRSNKKSSPTTTSRKKSGDSSDSISSKNKKKNRGPTVMKTLTELVSVPANRSCADCRSALVDISKVHASFCPGEDKIRATALIAVAIHDFKLNHSAFAPPQYQKKDPSRYGDCAIDPSKFVNHRFGGHGVFICSNCADAHRQLSDDITIVQSIQGDQHLWTVEQANLMKNSGGNARCWTVYEAYISDTWKQRRPCPSSTLEERIYFCKAKYEALAFIMPPPGPLSSLAWNSILERNQIARRFGLEGLKDINTLTPMTTGDEATHTSSPVGSPNGDNGLPNRLIDFFCVVSCSMQLHPNDVVKDLSKEVGKPEDLKFWPRVSDCYPICTKHKDTKFPEHLPTFVLPDGCSPTISQKPPTFFTTVLTQANGDNLYIGCLQIYDENVEMEILRKEILDSGYSGKLPKFLSSSDIVFLPKCLTLISHYPFFDLFRVALQQLYRITLVEAPLPIERYIANLTCEVPLPPQGKIKVELGITTERVITIERPPMNQLPMANFSFRPLFASLSVGNIIVVYSCLLEECKVVLLSQYTSLLCPVAEALVSALFPFEWQGLYVPVIPYSMLEILDAPVPFLIGIHSRYLHEVDPKRRPKDVVFVDLDRDVVQLGFDVESGEKWKVPTPPSRDAGKLKSSLEEAAGSVYIVPNSGIKGCILNNCDGRMVLVGNEERPKYAEMSSIPPDCNTFARKQVFSSSQRAYDDQDEAKEFIGGFRTVHGHITTDDNSDGSESSGEGNSNGQKFSRLVSPGFAGRKKKLALSKERAKDQAHLLDLAEPDGFSSDKIRDAFLRFIVSIFMNYKRCLRQNCGNDLFDNEKFLDDFKKSDPESIEFLHRILKTQMFQRFLEERQDNPGDPEIRYFDESIVAKSNRSKKSTLKAGKKPTPFLDSEQWKVTKAYSPPQPSNLGLPDSEMKYHYGTFPQLNYSLFGRTRPPMLWQQEYSRMSFRLKHIKPSTLLKTQEDIVKKAVKPVISAPGAIRAIARRSAKDLESALSAFSPINTKLSFNAPKLPSTQTIGEGTRTSDSISPDQTVDEKNVPSERSVDRMTRADTIIMNARRKQSILLDLVIKLQARIRMFIRRSQYKRIRWAIVLLQRKSREVPIFNPDEPAFLRITIRRAVVIQRNIRMHLAHLHAKKRSRAVLTVQRTFRGHFARVHLAQARSAAIVIQRLTKSRRTRFLFLQLHLLISKVQGVVRGRDVRRTISFIYSQRMSVYRNKIFGLWEFASVSLALRTRLWPTYRDGWGFSRLRLAETEICRLLTLLGREAVTEDATFSDEVIRQSDLIGIDSTIYRFSKTTLESLLKDDSSKEIISLSAENAAVVEAERLQVHDRLDSSTVPQSSIEAAYGQFGIPAGEKLKKVCLANSIWTDFFYVEQSSSTMLMLFPELESSLNIAFKSPSAKGRRRFPKACQVTSPPVDKSLWDEISLEGTIKKHVSEVASIYITKVPGVMAKLDEAEERKSRKWKTLVSAMVVTRSAVSWSDCRGNIIRDFLLSRDTGNMVTEGGVSSPTSMKLPKASRKVGIDLPNADNAPMEVGSLENADALVDDKAAPLNTTAQFPGIPEDSNGVNPFGQNDAAVLDDEKDAVLDPTVKFPDIPLNSSETDPADVLATAASSLK